MDRLLSNLGYGSRKEMAALARAGRITLDDRPLNRVDGRIALDPDLEQRLKIDGRPVDPLPGLVILMHKPLGVTCSHKDEGALVFDLLPQRWRRRDPPISTIGRLDKETSGLLLLTDDGDYLHRVISPKSNVAKVYRAQLARPLAGDEAALFASGQLMLEGEITPLKPAELDVIDPRQARLTLHEGRYHQVRRMFAAVGNHVEALHRERVGGLFLPDDLAPGDWRRLNELDRDRVFGRI